MNLQTIKKYVFELIMTLSQKKSLFSSKKIERFVSFNSAVTIIWVYFIVKLFCLVDCELTSTDVVLLSGTLLGYGGYNLYQTERAKKAERKDDRDDNTNDKINEIIS
jgi:hypothetical protein